MTDASPVEQAEALVERLRPVARQASAQAWSPHSGYRVGAAVRAVSGAVFPGCNVESDSYGLTQCAERNAFAAAIVGGVRPGEMDAVLIYVPGPVTLPPCGGCRQWMVELLAEAGRIVSCCDGDRFETWVRDELMAGAFRMR
ncbi:cytidine deaminase [Marinihelvus fidelis]|uniref:Cytidine deaminase n=1 Tax=Marinihelvus fidelis TaxID=2613842 RepID=A0A5N0TA73_9GAMM|nr:cytidine deaminase [Marinihelvus fidelis]KAA9131862.1 cytidine deaminase [Marinihelvus fidelis]